MTSRTAVFVALTAIRRAVAQPSPGPASARPVYRHPARIPRPFRACPGVREVAI